MERLVKSAIHKNGKVYTGRRHSDIIYKMARECEESSEGGTQGFVTDQGRFVSRCEGLTVAVASGQLPKERLDSCLNLTSEELW